ncbi:hypothetical protein ACKWTF_008066 [Chironomus riparius]
MLSLILCLIVTSPRVRLKMNFYIFCLICGAFANEISINGVLPESVTSIPEMQGRQDEDYEVIEESVSSTTEHWTTQGCSHANEYYNACGPRCQQTCSFQQRISGGNTRAICESIFSGSCHPGCFCQDGYVRFNDKCIKPVDCPSKLFFILFESLN